MDQETPQQDKSYENRLYPEDQAKVDAFLKRGVNAVERKPFKPFRMILLLIAVVTFFSILSQMIAWVPVASLAGILSQRIARWAGIY